MEWLVVRTVSSQKKKLIEKLHERGKSRMSDEIIKRRGGNHGSPTVGNNGLVVQEGDIAHYISSMMVLRKLPTPSTDEEIEQRIDLYFQFCLENDLRPGVEGLALALGVSRKALWDWQQGNTWNNSKRRELITQAKQVIAMLTEQMGLSGKLNPVSYIFTMKNHFSYVDKTELEIGATNNQLQPTMTMEEIAEKVRTDVVIDIDEE